MAQTRAGFSGPRRPATPRTALAFRNLIERKMLPIGWRKGRSAMSQPAQQAQQPNARMPETTQLNTSGMCHCGLTRRTAAQQAQVQSAKQHKNRTGCPSARSCLHQHVPNVTCARNNAVELCSASASPALRAHGRLFVLCWRFRCGP